MKTADYILLLVAGAALGSIWTITYLLATGKVAL